ncbi:molybdopterin-guanine dinucleotide biosynthesis protein B [Alkalibacillus aidingensis]|uniref:molybdopterin-guanine dinucleotide biosynthesis protein B n=1 Tax=Alkalibacillus aidingensis TaxID=2747607 RepID=UPI001660BDCD|nr:molybdopterin-guanine dinucleotide biosynthesis protein B [Alkalibacillus aidingensis]
MGNPRVIQVVGYKNSGKTTLVSSWVKLAKQMNKKVLTIKNHGHQSDLELPDSSVDSMQHFNQGADCSIAFGNGVLQMHKRVSQTVNLENFLSDSDFQEYDLIIVEGFKHERFPKVVILRNEEDHTLINELTNIKLAITHGSIMNSFDLVSINDTDKINTWFKGWVHNGEKI